MFFDLCWLAPESIRGSFLTLDSPWRSGAAPVAQAKASAGHDQRTLQASSENARRKRTGVTSDDSIQPQLTIRAECEPHILAPFPQARFPAFLAMR